MQTIVGQVLGRKECLRRAAWASFIRPRTIIDRLADVADSPQAVTALRSTLILGSILNTLDADELHKAMQVEEGDASLWKILKGLTTKEARQVAMVGVSLMNVIGKALAKRRAL